MYFLGVKGIDTARRRVVCSRCVSLRDDCKEDTEGCNNAIKTLKRVAFGFRNFRSFRARILLSLGPYPNI